MAAHYATGVIYRIGEIETRGNFTCRKFVLETDDNPKYPQFVEFQTSRGGMSKLDTLNPGDEVRVTFDLRGREWTSPRGEVKYFNTLEAWNIEVMKSAPRAGRSQTVDPPIGNDDIPF